MKMEANKYEEDILELINVIRNSDLDFDVVLAIGKGGTLPALYICSAFCRPMVVMFANRYPDRAGTRRKEVNISDMVGLFEVKKSHTILIVDDMTDEGVTLASITDLLKFHGYDKLLTAVVYVHHESKFTPHFWGRKLEGPDVWIHFPYDVCFDKECETCGGIAGGN